MTEHESEIVAKVRKLLRLAGNNPNAHEAALAAAKAQELIARYKLEVASLDGADEQKPEPVEGYYSHAPIDERTQRSAWRGCLAVVLGRENNCKPISVRYASRVSLRLIGTKSNVEIVTYLFAYCAREIERLTEEEMASNGRGEGRTWANNFRHGCVDGIAAQLREARERIRKEYAGTQALVRVDREALALRNYLASSEKFQRVNSSSRLNLSARAAGVEAGRSIALSRGLGSGRAQKRLS